MELHAEILDAVRQSWGWTGIDPSEIVGENDFGNLIIKDFAGRYWRVCPEDCYCQVVAEDRHALDILSIGQDFLRDWYVSDWVDEAKHIVGELATGRKYCLKIPGILGGRYGGENLASLRWTELISSSGDIARQIAGLPEGTKINIKITP